MTQQDSDYKFTERTYTLRVVLSYNKTLPEDGELIAEIEKLIEGQTVDMVAGSKAYVIVDQAELEKQ